MVESIIPAYNFEIEKASAQRQHNRQAFCAKHTFHKGVDVTLEGLVKF